MGWTVFWATWLVLGVLVESLALSRADSNGTLTDFMRSYLLPSPWGSLLVGSFLLWLIWHWLYVREGAGLVDLLALSAGATVGWLGWRKRNKDLDK